MHAVHTAPPRTLSSCIHAARDALVDALEDALDAAAVALTDRLVAHHACRACTRPGSYLRRTRVEREVTINTDRDDRLSVDRRGRGTERRRPEAAETLPAIARDRARARACEPWNKRAMLLSTSGSGRHGIGGERLASHLPQRELEGGSDRKATGRAQVCTNGSKGSRTLAGC